MQLVTLISKTTVLPQKPWGLRWSWIWTWRSKTNKNDHTTEKNPDVKLPASQYVATQIRRGHQITNSTQFPLRINYIIWELAKLIWLLFFTKKDSRNKAILCKFYIYTDTHTEYRACHCFGYLEKFFSARSIHRRRGWQNMRWLNGIINSSMESEQTPGDSEGLGSLGCCSPRGHKESDMT